MGLHHGGDPGFETLKETVFGLLAFIAAGARRQLGADDRQLVVIGAYEAPFRIKFIALHAGADGCLVIFQVQTDTAIARALGKAKMAPIALGMTHGRFEIGVTDTYLLHAQNIGLLPS